MAWIEFHATRIKRLKKFSDLRRALGWSVHETLGFLGDWWGQTVEVCESGEVTGWTSEYLSELTGLGPQVSPRVWVELGNYGWIDKDAGGRLLIHDWTDWAGRFLRGKYSGKENRQKLVDIWALHGRVYGEKEVTDKLPTSSVSETDSTIPYLILPNQPNQTKEKTKGGGEVKIPPDLEPNSAEILEWLVFKKEKNQGYKPKGLVALWSALRKIPAGQRKEAIEHSMASNYAGIYETKGGLNGTRSHIAGAATPNGTGERIVD